MTITLHRGDIPSGLDFGDCVAVDAEMMGLNPARDRLCLVQLSAGDGTAHLVQFRKGEYDAPNLKKLLSDPGVTKILHFARADVCAVRAWLGVWLAPVWCTKTASRLARTFSDYHSLKTVCRDLLGLEISKQQQTTDWGAEELTQEQLEYAAADVLHLHGIKARLEEMLVREGRMELAQACFGFIPSRAALDLAGWPDLDIFAH